MRIEVEEVPDDAQTDIVELVVADSLARAAASGLAALDENASLTSLASFAFTSELTRPPAMQLAIVDLHDLDAARAVIARRRIGMIGVAIIIADSLGDELRCVADRFDAFLQVAGRDRDKVAAAAEAVVAAITADRLALPVDAVYPFFENAGELSCGHATGSDLEALAGQALRLSASRGGRKKGRALVHVRTSGHGDSFYDVLKVLSVVEESVHPNGIEWSCSVARSVDDLSVSIIASDAQHRPLLRRPG